MYSFFVCLASVLAEGQVEHQAADVQLQQALAVGNSVQDRCCATPCVETCRKMSETSPEQMIATKPITMRIITHL